MTEDRPIMVNIIDAINNKVVTETKVVAQKNDIWVLDNHDERLNRLLYSATLYRLEVQGDEDSAFLVKPIKIVHQHMAAKLIPVTGGRERRRYLRIPCDFETQFVIDDAKVDGRVLELAYGSMVISIKERMEKNDDIIAHLKELDGEVALNCSVFALKLAPQPESEEDTPLWKPDCKYVILIDGDKSGEHAMELLYSKLCRMQKTQMGDERR